MSERFSGAAEKPFEASPEHSEHKQASEALRASESIEHKHLKNVEHIRHLAHEQARSSEAIKPAEASEPHKPTEAYVTRELKDTSYNRLLTRARKNLSPPARLISRVIHQPVVDAVSQSLAKTVARPSGIFGGGALALIGTLAYYFLTRHYGYNYSYSVFLLLLVAGFVAGWVAEFLWRLLRQPKS